MRHSKILSHNLKLLRKSNGISAKELSNKLGFSDNRIHDIENALNANIHDHEIKAICGYFMITYEDLVNKKAVVVFI